MSLITEFIEIPLSQLHREAAVMKTDGWRFIQTHAVNTDAGVDLYYSFMKDGLAKNLKVVGVTKDQQVPSITDLFLAAFVFENEARELFGVDMRDIAIDFSGAMYAPAIDEPMTILTPEMKAAREKARKAQKAKEAKEAQKADADASGKASTAESGSHTAKVFVMTPERRQRLDAKLANMPADKVAKVQAALKAREAEAAALAGDTSAAASDAKPAVKAAVEEAAKPTADVKEVAKPAVDHELEAKINLLGAEKAQMVRAAIAARSGVQASESESASAAPVKLDALVESKIALMSDEKAEKVRAALAAKAARAASRKGGE